MAVIEELQPKRAFLTHLSHEFDHNTYEAGLPDHVRLAYDGLRIRVLQVFALFTRILRSATVQPLQLSPSKT